jgi:PAS domain S-box-containing protein
VCKGEDWRLLAWNDACRDFFRQLGREKADWQDPGKALPEETLVALLRQAGHGGAAECLRSSAEAKPGIFSINTGSYYFAWTFVPPAGKEKDEPDLPEKLRFFFFHEASPPPILSEYELLSQELQAIIDSMHDGIWVINGDGVTVHVNKAMKRIADINPADVIGQHVSESVKEGKFFTSVALAALEQKKPVTLFDDYPCGARCLNTSTPIFDDTGQIWRVVASIRDMTELEDLQKRLAEAELAAHMYKRKLDNVQQDRASEFVANSAVMRACLRGLERAARAPSGILILGETGTGKTLAASLIHQKSPRAKFPFISINCAAIPSTLIESELFGYERGAFTGAGQAGKKGFFELADKGTLLLDEVGELPLNMQAKLLHVLDNQTFHKVGGEKSIKVDVRIIAATNRSLEQLVGTGDFRADLYYRLRVLNICLPPLREHPEDIPELSMNFLEEACKRHGVTKTFSPKVLRCFAAHPWSGNVRELRAVVEFLAAMAESSIIRLTDLPPSLFAGNADTAAIPESFSAVEHEEREYRPQDLKAAVRTLEKSMISSALSQGGSTYKAAKILRVSQSTVVRKAKELGIGIAE